MRIVVAGAGVGGLAAALACGRAGHEVVLVERDAHPGPAAPLGWARPGVPQFHHPHLLLALGCRELLLHAPDVYVQLLAAGAEEITVSHPDALLDPELRALGLRRPLLDWALRAAVAAEPGIINRYGEPVRDIVTGHGGAVVGVRTESSTITGDLVVDAMGLGSPLTARLAEEVSRHSCGMTYYSRFFRLRYDNPARPGHLPMLASVDLGYLNAALYWADNRHVGLIIAAPSGDRELRLLRGEPAYTQLIDAVPVLAAHLGPEAAEPVTPVLPMGGLQASWRHTRALPGVVSIGDALCHTNPLYGWGASIALAQGFALPGLLAGGADAVGAQVALGAVPRGRFVTSLAIDDRITRHWAGVRDDPLPVTDPDEFRVWTLGLAARRRPDLYQRQMRWAGLLDPAEAIDADGELRGRAVDAARAALAELVPEPVPSRPELLALMRAAAG